MATNCENCKAKQVDSVPYVVHESDMARMSKVIEGLWIIILILIVLLVGTNIAWIAYESQFETVSETVAQDVWQETSGGDNSFIGGDAYGYTENPYSEDYENQTP